MNNTNFTPVFKIYKEGRTTHPQTILFKNDEPFHIIEKMEFYESLGYSIIELTNDDIEKFRNRNRN